MKKPHFVVVIAHSVHGRLQRVHLSHTVIYAVLSLALVGCFTVAGFVSSYARLAWKAANYNTLRDEVENLQKKVQALQVRNEQTKEQLATLQVLATEVSMAYGLKSQLEGPATITAEGKIMPSYEEALETYGLLKTARIFNPLPRKSSSAARLFPHVAEHTVPSGWPVQGRLVSPFGMRLDPFLGVSTFHSGVDISCNVGMPIIVSGDGVVRLADWMNGYGKTVAVDHGDGKETYYAHLSSINVIPGQNVYRGQVVGRCGSTGRSTGPHLHYEVRQGGAPVNPYTYLNKASALTPASVEKDLPF